MAIMKVKADAANLRRSPEIRDDNIITTLVLSQEVDVIEGNPPDRFWKVKTTVNGTMLEGFVSASLLRKPASAPKEALISAAVREWLRFDQGDKFEFEDPQFRFIGEYWSKIGQSLDGQNRDQPWSAAYISFVVRAAGYSGFKFAAAHSTYVIDAVDKRQANDTTAPFWGFELNEHKPQLGDLVCRSRAGAQISSMANLPRGGFKSHCDIVVEVKDTEVRTLGGNVGDSVSISTYLLDGNKFLRKANNVYGILRNNL
jgi:hypothetical protein